MRSSVSTQPAPIAPFRRRVQRHVGEAAGITLLVLALNLLLSSTLLGQLGWREGLLGLGVALAMGLMWALSRAAWTRASDESVAAPAQRVPISTKQPMPSAAASRSSAAERTRPSASYASEGAASMPPTGSASGALQVLIATRPGAPSLELPPALRAALDGLAKELYLLASERCFVLEIAGDLARQAAKSQASAQLAWSLAEAGHARVLLLEADLSRPALARLLEVEVPPLMGFSQQLHRRSAVPGAAWTVLRVAPCLDLLAEGRVRTPGMLYSDQLSRALSDLRAHYDIIVVDAPRIATLDDARALEGVADGIVLLGAGDRTIEQAIEQYRHKRLCRVL